MTYLIQENDFYFVNLKMIYIFGRVITRQKMFLISQTKFPAIHLGLTVFSSDPLTFCPQILDKEVAPGGH